VSVSGAAGQCGNVTVSPILDLMLCMKFILLSTARVCNVLWITLPVSTILATEVRGQQFKP
jgi:hypothetical protein